MKGIGRELGCAYCPKMAFDLQTELGKKTNVTASLREEIKTKILEVNNHCLIDI